MADFVLPERDPLKNIRNFERVFTREVGIAPSRYVAQLRIEAARRQLAQTGKSLEQIAASCGFGSADLMRRAFVRTIGITPARYRKSVST
jgi:transcriptional regulator GlxA family with amidase domain